MKNFYRTSLPESITYNKVRYVSTGKTVDSLKLEGTTLSTFVSTMKFAGKRVILCNVLSRNLRGRTDLHNKPYKPSQWLFVS